MWCEAEGHEVTFVCYTGFENLVDELPDRVDLVFIGAFTEAALLAYALSNLFRSRGAVTVLGGPHARCYPEDARKYFDYVVGFTDQAVIREVLRDCSPHRPIGPAPGGKAAARHAPRSARALEVHRADAPKGPRLQDRADARQPGLPLHLQLLHRLGRPLSAARLRGADRGPAVPRCEAAAAARRLARSELRRPIRRLPGRDRRGRAARPDRFVAESSLSLLSEPHLKRLERSGFKALLPGVESWYDLGNKSKTGQLKGMDKVRQVSEHVNMILRYVPYVQTNFVLGLDSDAGEEPFELTKRFVDLTPGAFPGYSLLSAFGRAAPLNLEYQRADRVLPFPFHFLDNNHAMNVKPKNYSWRDFYDRVIGLTQLHVLLARHRRSASERRGR